MTTTRRPLDYPELLTRAEVATMFGVCAETVTRWARAGKVSCIWTIGGHRRYDKAEIQALLKDAES